MSGRALSWQEKGGARLRRGADVLNPLSQDFAIVRASEGSTRCRVRDPPVDERPCGDRALLGATARPRRDRIDADQATFYWRHGALTSQSDCNRGHATHNGGNYSKYCGSVALTASAK